MYRRTWIHVQSRVHTRTHTDLYTHTYLYTCAGTHPVPTPAPSLGPQGRSQPDGQLSLRSLRSQEEMPGDSGRGEGLCRGGEPPRGPCGASSLQLCPRSPGAFQVLRHPTATCPAAGLPLRTRSVPLPPVASLWWAWALGQGLRGG